MQENANNTFMKVIELFTFLFASGRIISLRLEHGVLHNIAIYSVICEAHIWKHCYMHDHISSLKGEFVTTHKTSLRSVRTYSQQRERMYIWEFWFPKNIMCATNYIFYNITPYNRLSGQQMLSGTQIITTSHGMTGRNFFDVFLLFYLLFGF